MVERPRGEGHSGPADAGDVFAQFMASRKSQGLEKLDSVVQAHPELADSLNVLKDEWFRYVDDLYGSADTVTESAGEVDSPHPEVVGPYEIADVLGQGGMGIVYRARQREPDRFVALKMIHPGLLTERARKRFSYEISTLGRLEDEGIARIYDAGLASTHRGVRPYFAMEYVDGLALTEYASRKALGVRQKLELFCQVCDAVHYAHQQGVVHRDLKPGNIFVDAKGKPKILDFGVAKSVEVEGQSETMKTLAGQIVGTLAYMSPEQTSQEEETLDTRSDVYSLGVVLYELLGGKLPYEVADRSLFDALKVIREVEPVALSSIQRGFRGDVDTIVAKALEKERERRYPSASELAQDIRRYLNFEPIVARPASTIYQLKKFTQRHRSFTVAVLGIAAALVVATVVSLWQKEIADYERGQAVEARTASDANLAKAEALIEGLTTFFASPDPYVGSGREVTVREAIDQNLDGVLASLDRYPLMRARVLETVGLAAYHLGDLDKSRDFLHRALDLREGRSADDDPSIARNWNTLSTVTLSAGDIEASRTHVDAALAWFQEHRGPEDQETLSARINLSSNLSRSGEWSDARLIVEDVLEIEQRIHGPRAPAIAMTRQNLASIYWNLGEFQLAQESYEESIAIRRETGAMGHPDALTAVTGLANVFYKLGKHEDALELLNGACAEFEAELGEDHFITLSAKNNYATVLIQVDPAEARVLLDELVPALKKELGPRHRTYLSAGQNLALSMTSSGEAEKAIPLLEELVESFREVSGPESHETGIALHNLAMAASTAGDRERSRDLYEEALESLQAVLGRDHITTLSTQKNLAVVVYYLGDPARSRFLLNDCRRRVMRTVGAEHPHIGSVDRSLSILHRSLEQQFANRQGAYELASAGGELIDEACVESLVNWATVAIAAGRASELRDALESTLYALEEEDEPDPIVTANLRVALGRAYLEDGELEEAEEPLLEAWELLSEGEASEAERVRALRALIECYSALEDEEEETAYWESLEEAG